MENLISTTDFVLEQEKNIATQKAFVLNNKMFNYANFLKKKNKLGYFVPCDENDKPLEEPIFSIVNYGASTESVKYYEIDKKRYQEAKQRVLFEGFEISYEDGAIFPFLGKFPIGFFSIENEWVLSDEFKTIEDLVEFNLKLSDTAKKEILFKQVKCYDKFNQLLKEGDYVDVQKDGVHQIYLKEDNQLYFKPYGKEDKVSSYFSNDMVKCDKEGNWLA